MTARLLALLLGTPLLAAEISPNLPPEAATGCTLAWHDEFDGDKLNSAEWNIRTGERFASNNTAANVRVADCLLRLAVRKEKAGNSDYTSGGVISKREFKYGYYEARYRVPRGAAGTRLFG